MSSPCKVSVVIPLLPGQKFSRKSLLSVARQTVRDFEILLIDGGASPDLERKISDQAGSLGLNFRWIRDHRENMSALRNCGILNSRSDYVAFHNYSDLMAPTRIEEGTKRLDRRPDLVLVSSFVDSGEEGKGGTGGGPSHSSRQSRLWAESERMLDGLVGRVGTFGARPSVGTYHIPEATTMIVRRPALLAAGLYDMRFSESPWATLELSVRLSGLGSFERIGVPLVRKVFKSRPLTPEVWMQSMDQMDLFYLLLAWRCGNTPDRETRRLLGRFRTYWLRYWSRWFFQYRDGRKDGLRLALRALSGNFLGFENWKWMVKSLFPQSQYPRLFWFDRFIDSPVPFLWGKGGIGDVLSSDWRLM